jgi:hydrogenase expression/formation protein HypE
MMSAGDVHFMRDATRGGVGTVLNEIAREANLGIAIREDAVPVRDEVRGAAEILGIHPLYVANEGRVGRGGRERNWGRARRLPLAPAG